ncbi:MAG: class B sortase [Clostridia bacterium]|nr:class B sortase [Clostridia bacterium]
MKHRDWQYKLVDGLDEAVNLAMLSLFFAVLLLALYAGYDARHIDAEASSSAYAAYKPVDEEHLIFDELMARNPDVFGWVSLDDTTVDYPVVQGTDNDHYINTDVYGDFALTGSIFLDSRNARSMTDSVNILYGHHMEGPIMFGVIDQYETSSFFDSHRAGTLYYEGLSHPLNIFAFVRTDGYNTGVYAPGTTPSEKPQFLEAVRQSSVIYREDYDASLPLLLLSTCESGTTNGRMLLVATIGEGTPPSGVATQHKTFFELYKWQCLALLVLLLFLTLLFWLGRRKRKQKEESSHGE